MYVPTEDLALPHAIAEREGKRDAIVETLIDHDGWLTAEELAAEVGENRVFVRELCGEIVGEWISRREGRQGVYEFRCRGIWTTTTYQQQRVHDDPNCMFVSERETSIRPATEQEANIWDDCKECNGEAYRSDSPDWSAFNAAKEAGDD